MTWLLALLSKNEKIVMEVKKRYTEGKEKAETERDGESKIERERGKGGEVR